jgi:heme A synthase
MFFMITEALVGAGLVLFGLVAQNDSFARAWVMAFHLANTFLLLGCLSLSAWWSRLRRESPWQRPRRNLALPLAILGGLLLIGVSGAVAALGDTLFPSLTVSEALARDFAPDAHLLIQLRVYHPVLALVLGIVVIFGAFRLMGSETGTSRFALGVLLIVVYLSQLGLGLLNLALLAPVWLQLVHLAVADTVWITAVLLTGSSLITGETGEN